MASARESGDLGGVLLGLFERHGCELVDTPVLQPADVFLDMLGEDVRRRLFLTQDEAGHDLCLRPDYTIPICREHLQAARTAPADYCYLGPVFRQRLDGFGEFLQVGVESLGRTDLCPADADMLGLALDASALARPGPYDVRIGDTGLLAALLEALDLPPPARRRILRLLAAGKGADALAPEERNGGPAYAGLLAAIAGQDPKAARAFVQDVISIAGVATVGGRTAGEIAERFLSKAENRSADLSDRQRTVLARYLEVRGGLDDCADAMRVMAKEEHLDLAAALERFEDRTGFIAARGIDLGRLAFAADFVRALDYYTGFVFEIRDAARPDAWYLAAGGRYDRLLEQLGSPEPVPAVGCSFWLDRFAEAKP